MSFRLADSKARNANSENKRPRTRRERLGVNRGERASAACPVYAIITVIVCNKEQIANEQREKSAQQNNNGHRIKWRNISDRVEPNRAKRTEHKSLYKAVNHAHFQLSRTYTVVIVDDCCAVLICFPQYFVHFLFHSMNVPFSVIHSVWCVSVLSCFLSFAFRFLCCEIDILLLCCTIMRIYVLVHVLYVCWVWCCFFSFSSSFLFVPQPKGLIATACVCDKQTESVERRRNHRNTMAHTITDKFSIESSAFLVCYFQFDLRNAFDITLERGDCNNANWADKRLVIFCLVTRIESR